MVILRKARGYTLVELMVMMAMLITLASIGAPLLINANKAFILNRAKIELQRDARTALATINRNLRQASSTTINISRQPGQPHYSAVTFRKAQGNTLSYYQSGTSLIEVNNGRSRTLTRDLRFLSFGFPRSDDMGIVSVAMTLERTIYQGQLKSLHMASDKVRVMN